MTTPIPIFGDMDGITISWLKRTFAWFARDTDNPQLAKTHIATRHVGTNCGAFESPGSVTEPTNCLRVQSGSSGGQRNPVTEEILVTLRAYALTESEAEWICQLARSFVKAMPYYGGLGELVSGTAGFDVYQVIGDTSVYLFNDPDAGWPSYQCSVQLLVSPESYYLPTEVS